MALPPVAALLRVATTAARRGAAELTAAYGSALTVAVKSHLRDIVTEADTASERAILAFIGDRWPQIGLLSEEAGLVRPAADAIWIIDPLDGSANFAHGYPNFCVSIGCFDRDGPVVGVILDPLRNELFTAARGEGAFLNGDRLRVSMVEEIGGALFSTGFPYYPAERRRLAGDVFTVVMSAAGAARRSGSAALDLAYVAAGRSESHYEFILAPHDVAAGVLLVTEAGGRVEALAQPGEAGWPAGIIATNGTALHEQLARLIAPFGLERRPVSAASLFPTTEAS